MNFCILFRGLGANVAFGKIIAIHNNTLFLLFFCGDYYENSKRVVRKKQSIISDQRTFYAIRAIFGGDDH